MDVAAVYLLTGAVSPKVTEAIVTVQEVTERFAV